MTTPGGASEGVSWVDVAASAAGIEAQMRQIGNAAAGAFSQQFNSRVSSELGQVMDQLGGKSGSAFTSALGKELLGGLGGPVGHVISGLKTAFKASEGEAAAAGAGMGAAAMGGLAVAAVAGVELLKDGVKQSLRVFNDEAEQFGKVGSDAANSMMGGLTSVLAGKTPDVMSAMNVITEGMQAGVMAPLHAIDLGIDTTVGHIPIIGDIFKTTMSEVETAVGGAIEGLSQFEQLGGQFTEQMLQIGDQWQETARKISGQTLGDDQLRSYMGILRDMAASGGLANFQDAADAIGLLGQRLSGLGDGAGLSNDQLRELTTTLAQADELLGGTKINVDNLTAAFNDFGVAPEHANDELTTLVNISRLTGDNINGLLQNVDNLGPVLQSLGYDLDQTAFFAGRMNQELGPIQASRMGASFQKIDENLRKSGASWQDMISVVQAYHAAGDDAAGVDYLKGMGASARNAAAFLKLINDGILATPENVQKAMDAVGPALHQPFEQAVEDSRRLEDSVEQLSNQLKASLAGIGIPLVQGLTAASDHLKTWLAEHGDEIVHWGSEAMDTILQVSSTVLEDFGHTLEAVAPWINTFKNWVIQSMQGVVLAMQAVVEPLALLPSALGGDKFKAMSKDLGDAMGALTAAKDTDIAPWLQQIGDGLDHIGQKAQDARQPVADSPARLRTCSSSTRRSRATFRRNRARSPRCRTRSKAPKTASNC
jgi:hypothetical protein